MPRPQHGARVSKEDMKVQSQESQPSLPHSIQNVPLSPDSSGNSYHFKLNCQYSGHHVHAAADQRLHPSHGQES